jgi:2-C-methyl-D-erythritol 2,4-cyclodiphosphate synthase
MDIRVGLGFDVHKFAPGRNLILGGIRIEHPLGLMGHSDADVLIHAIIDSLMGPCNLGDIGTNFPDTDPQYRGISSIDLLKLTFEKLDSMGIVIVNIDSVIVCQKPKIAQYIPDIKNKLSAALNNFPVEKISVKGKTTEGLGFTGREEGIASYAVSLVSFPQ